MICSSNANLNIDLKLPVALEAVRRLHLSGDDLRVLRKNFNYIDDDESGEIDYLEFLDHMGERRTVFTDKVYSLIDENGDGELEFDEFVAVCGTLCCWSKEETLKFCFDAFDFGDEALVYVTNIVATPNAFHTELRRQPIDLRTGNVVIRSVV